EASRLISAAASPLKEILIVALHSGLRRGELLSLRWTDIHGGAIHLRAEVCKSGKSRVVPIDDTVHSTLESLERNGPLVFHCRGRPILSLRAAWKKACDAAGIKDFRLHDARHTWCTWTAENG